ncbi:DUF3019 domain-containing protein [Pseudoalteromonas sp. MMG013]|uniref:DUF3019 domain-containing protein n=1 Tax=Pseudoalteromonas aurantia 208 TaxID=1314867 RepID=A0ABR9ECG8_9GAMM|nr:MULTISPECIES: DUF3019 domain-containing protein [Pseudoalteromonas]MBE0367458.1 hypothetical protein [Pseudoalteromonas aurantia 208]MBQ4845829.1 DUF3019 domain-containing protein [Pseudoalteromonas sp. MMG005]MBQ4861912.1 DUF3019 domain-containing protein [Pseudoalteromonas sp. MMG013]
MYFNSLSVLFLVQLTPEAAIPIPPTLLVQPERCIALRKGRNCYAQLTFSWDLPIAANYCLKSSNSESVLYCWQAAKSGHVEHEFNQQKTHEYQLINSDTGAILGQTQVHVQWVYKNRQKKRRWRLF